jgi:serine protease inhibitor
VTSIGIVATSAQIPTQPFEMVLDRPFFCAIRDNETGTILFMGQIQNPEG